MWKDKTVILGVSGGIAAYKAITICSRLTQLGAKVHVIMTESAASFVQPLSFQAISRFPVHVNIMEEHDPSVITHIDLADRADVIVVAPATANFIGKYAHGIADDMLTTTLLAATAPVMIAPAMNVHMLKHPAVQHNLQLLEERGVQIIRPGTGQLACGYVGEGRLAEPEQIIEQVEAFLLNKQGVKPLLGKSLLVTAGGTRERIDPVRYITNDSSGKMGHAIAEAGAAMGAEVTLITASSLAPPQGVQAIQVQTADDMYQEVIKRYRAADLIVKAAAVSDYRPVTTAKQKMKKGEDKWVLELTRTRDILAEIGSHKEPRQFVIGFAAETERLEEHAMNKLINKKLDLIVANDVSQEGAGFNTDTNICSIYGPEGLVASLPLMSKRQAANRLLEIAAARMAEQKGKV